MLQLLATVSPPAAGAPLTQILIGTLIAGSMTGGVFLAAWLHRTGRTTLLTRAGDALSHVQGVPAWAALPYGVGLTSLGLAFVGVYWDISLHVDQGRDAGPLANAAHYPILFGLQGVFLAGVLAMVMPPKNAYVGPSAVQLTPRWRTSVAAIVLMACATMGYLGFPLDDVWHRLFGQDVTLWGPTHLMMIFGAVLAIFALAIMLVEGERAFGPAKSRGQGLRRRFNRIQLGGAMLIAGSLLAGEWDWGIQQYLMEWRPALLAGTSALVFVAMRRWVGRGGAIAAAAYYAVARLIVNLLVGEGFDQTQPAMPIFFAEALIVEAIALIPALRRSTPRLAIATGLGIGTVGFAAQYGWSQIAMPIAWQPELLRTGMPLAIVAATAAAVLGSLLAQSLRGTLADEPRRRPMAIGAGIALLAVAGIAANQDYAPGPQVTTTLSAERQLSPATGDGPLESAIREATITTRFADPSAVENAQSMMAIAWQGGGVVVAPLKEIAPGTFRAERPVPLGGNWKTVVRLQLGRRLLAAPVELPADPAIPVKGHSNPGTETLQMRNELLLLQRERLPDVPVWLWAPASSLVLGLVVLMMVGIAFGAARVGLRVLPEDPSTTGDADARVATGPASPAAPGLPATS